MKITSVFRSVVRWLRAGYPERAPGPERVPLLALLCPTPLTDEQVDEVVGNILADTATEATISRDEIDAHITDVTHHDAGPENIQRVADALAAAGWTVTETDEAG